MRRKFSRVFSPDPRDNRFLIPKTTTTRISRNWKDTYWSGDQLDNPSCVAHAWKGFLSSSPISQGKLIDPEGLYELCKYRDEWKGENYDGTSVRAGADVLSTIGFIAEYQWAFTLDRIIETVLEVGPMVVGTNWYRNMNFPDGKGVIEASGRLLGGHAYVITGCNTKTEMFRIKQSWGLEWGDEGHAYISFSDLESLLGEDGEACQAKEVKA